jgi:phage anti-repressor protein
MNIEEVLQIKEQMLGDYSVQAVDGRSLYDALEIKARFRDWMPTKLIEAGAILDKDYTTYEREKIRSGGSDYREYTICISLAKDIAMLSRGNAAQKVRDYFKQCEKSVQSNAQQLIASTNQQSAIEDFTIINNLFTQQLINNGYSQGEIRKNTLLTGIEYEKKTGVKVLAPMLQLENTNGVNSIELSAYEGTHSALSEVAGTSIVVSDIANRYKYVTSKMVNAELESLGYQRNHDNLGKKYYWVKTDLSNLYAESGPLVSGPYKGLHVVKGWRFDPIKFPNFYNILHSRLLELEDRLKIKYDKN